MYILVQSLVTQIPFFFLPDVKQQMFLWMIINTSRTKGTVTHFQWLHLVDSCVNHCLHSLFIVIEGHILVYMSSVQLKLGANNPLCTP